MLETAYSSALLSFENRSFREYVLCAALLIGLLLGMSLLTSIIALLRNDFLTSEDYLVWPRFEKIAVKSSGGSSYNQTSSSPHRPERNNNSHYQNRSTGSSNRSNGARNAHSRRPSNGKKTTNNSRSNHSTNNSPHVSANSSNHSSSNGQASNSSARSSNNSIHKTNSSPTSSRISDIGDSKPYFHYVDLERMRRAHQNALENIVPFLVLGLIYVLCGLPHAVMHFFVFTIARFSHAFIYIFCKAQPYRTIFYYIGWLSMSSMCCRLIYAVMME